MRCKTQLLLVPLLPLAALAQPRAFPQPAPPHEVTITAIPGVISAGEKWVQVWQGPATADGIVGYKGGLLFAQEQTNKIIKLDPDGKASVFLATAHGPGAVAIDAKGHILAVERSCTDPGGHLGVKPADCKEPTDVAQLTPSRKILADKFDGKGLGRVNDLVARTKGGVYFTSGGAYYLSPSGQVSAVGQNLRTNGINLSPDEKTLYVTNGPVIVAFDVQPDGSTTNQRDFGRLEAGGSGDGMAIDAEGRIYDTTNAGIQVLDSHGRYLGLIPTPRAAISAAFSGPGKKTLYVGCMGAIGPDGKEIRTEPGVRNVAMTVYKISLLSAGFKGRAK